MKDTISISEIFGPTVQGEGMLIGVPTVFVRTGGCDYRCSWCDTLYAVLPEYKAQWRPETPAAILEEIQKLSKGKPLLVTLSGGNPAIQPLEELIRLGREAEYTFALETQGSIAKPWFALLNYLTLSPKAPSSGMKTQWDRLDQCVAYGDDHAVNVGLKVVVFDDTDYDYAKFVARRYPHVPMYLQVGNPQVSQNVDTQALLGRLEWLIDKVVADAWYNVTVLPQLHTLVWGNKRGV